MSFDVAAVVAWLKLTATTAADDNAVLTKVVAAVTEYIDGLESAPLITDPDTQETSWAAQTEFAALMLAGRLYRRRLSPAGIEAFGEDGSAYVSRTDSDIARMLRIDAFNRPKIG